jgi:hypothetical protein
MKCISPVQERFTRFRKTGSSILSGFPQNFWLLQLVVKQRADSLFNINKTLFWMTVYLREKNCQNYLLT